jgi:hypothetical protein
MLNKIRILINLIINIFNKSWKYFQKSYSQEGEDLILDNFFKNKKNGFYIDIGACHPFRFSNTYFFYKKGWRGINIDATPGSMRLFNKHRPRDINIEVGIGNSNINLKYYIFNEPALNSFSTAISHERSENTPYKLENIIQLKTKKLFEVLDKHMPVDIPIDFMSIDVEMFEYQVVVSNNWSKYKPKYLLVELIETKIDDFKNNKTYKFLTKNKYFLVAVTGRTVIFKQK